jgi:hypothetical protein
MPATFPFQSFQSAPGDEAGGATFKDQMLETLPVGHRSLILQTPHTGPRPVSFSLEKLE